MRTFISIVKLLLLCLAVSTAAHGTYLAEWSENRFMAGPNDGLAQMLPFKTLLYENYTAGEFFYSEQFGLGAGLFSGLAYYFSTSAVFLLTVAVLFLLETLGAIPTPDLLFWANAAVFISIIRLTAVLAIACSVFRYMKFDRVPSFLGAAVYGLSGMYFRHTVFWEFFADAYLWLPILLLGAEKIFRERKPGWFLAAVAVSMFDNFYFAYINFLLAGIYILFRLFLPLEEKETDRKSAILLFLLSGLIGAGISAVSFVPAVHAFLNNHRPPYPLPIPWTDFSDNILFTSRFIVLPALFVLMALLPPLYRNRSFRFFALLVLAGIVLHFSPKAGSLFNGFSAPQYRWEYFIAFTAGGAVAAGFSGLKYLKLRHVAAAGTAAALLYAGVLLLDKRLEFETLSAGILAGAGLMLLLLAAAVHRPGKTSRGLLSIALILTLIGYVNVYQKGKLVEGGNTQMVSESFITGSDYDDPEVRSLIEQIQERETDPVYRIDWMEGVRNNTPIVQDFRGLSAYSSILNKELLYFYLYDLEIDMARESVSRYATLGKRTNLHSLLQGTYVILPEGDPNVPAGFQGILSSEDYAVYENPAPLPFVRSASTVYSEEALEEAPVLTREHAMLSGVVLNEAATSAPLPPAPKELPFRIQEAEADYEDGLLKVNGRTGGINLLLEEPPQDGSDLYVAFHLKNRAEDAGFPLSVNEYRTTRKSNASVYKTYVDDLTIRIPADETVRIRVPEGTYELTGLTVYEEPYDVLRKEAADEPDENLVEWEGSHIRARYRNEEGGTYLVMPVPYEAGWTAKVNGKAVEVMEANYAFIAVPAAEGLNEIELTYRPPYFYLSLLISLVSAVVAVLFVRKRKRR